GTCRAEKNAFRGPHEPANGISPTVPPRDAVADPKPLRLPARPSHPPQPGPRPHHHQLPPAAPLRLMLHDSLLVFAIALPEIATACSSNVVTNSAGSLHFRFGLGGYALVPGTGFPPPNSAHLCIDAEATRRKLGVQPSVSIAVTPNGFRGSLPSAFVASDI